MLKFRIIKAGSAESAIWRRKSGRIKKSSAEKTVKYARIPLAEFLKFF